MDPDDAIQQLLKNTGWSCDDLLQRLQKIKHSTADDVNNKESTSEDTSTCLTKSILQHNSIVGKGSTGKVSTGKDSTGKDSTGKVSTGKVSTGKVSTGQEIATKIKESYYEIIDSNVSSTIESVSKDIVPKLNIKCGESPPSITKEAISSSTTDDKQFDETFSDTDEEEELVNTTNANIINEIIDDISTTDSQKPKPDNELPTLEKLIPSTNDKTEFTEVRVIEVDDEAEKSEYTYTTMNVDKEDIRNQPQTDEYETITIQTEEPEIETKSEEDKKIEYVEIHPRKRYKLVEKASLSTGLTERPLPNNIKLIKRLPLSPPPLISRQHDPLHFRTSSNSQMLQKPGTYILKKRIISSKGSIPRQIVTNNLVELKKAKQIGFKPRRVIKSNIYKKFTLSPSEQDKNIYSGRKIVKQIWKSNETVETVNAVNKEKASDIKLSPLENKKPTIPPFIKQISGQTKLFPKVEPICGTLSEGKPSLPIKPQSQTIITPSLLPANSTSVSKKICESVFSNSYRKIPPYIPVSALDFNTILTTQKSDLSNQTPNKLSYPAAIGKTVKIHPPGFEDSDEEINSSETPSTKTLEELRNSLKLQLDSLRTRKKKTFLTTPSTQLIDTNMECSKKLSLLEAKESQIKIPNGRDVSNRKSLDVYKEAPTFANISETSEAPQEKCLSDNELYTQTNELGLIILDVQGGVELDEPDNEIKKIDSNKNDSVSDNLIDNSNSVEKNIVKGATPYKEDNTEQVDDNIDEIRVFDQIRNIINKSKTKNLEKSGSSSKIKIPTNLPMKIEEDKKIDISSLSGENSQSSFVESSEVEEKSPFVSDTLDEFLTASRLNISYQVPKLGAEDGLQNFAEPLKNFVKGSPLILKKFKTVKEPLQKLKSTTVIKAKTVAQKRRLLERERKKELRKLEKMKFKQNKLKHDLEIKEEVVEETKKIQYKDKSYVLFNDNRIWVNSYCPNSCIARIDCTKEVKDPTLTPKSIQRKKWSLLCPKRKMDSTVRYRPGPLCQKQNLQISGNDKWETHLLKLPEVKLEVTPMIGQRFCDDILHRFSSVIGGELDKNSIEFAISMVQTKTEPKEKQASFEFPLRFQNKVEHVLVRRKKQLTTQFNIEKSEKSDEIRSSKDPVADLIEDLIRYIEIKELAPSLIKEDETHIKVEDKLDTLLSPVIDNNVSIFKKPQRKRSKIEIELLRLNCKVVNVEVEETEEEKCKKPFCELGCVCKSLKCEYIATHHCQKVACMFECTCPKEKSLIYDKLTLPPGTNVLSEDAVTRIEDEAKKNLAKVEREFTQTVIHTSDKTIVVGIGSRTKTRRSAKIPAKFTDFIPSAEVGCEEDKLSRICHVRLAKINLSQIVPYCLTHNIYDCFCKGQDLWQPMCLQASNVSKDNLFKPSLNEVIIPKHKLKLRPKLPKKYTYDIKESEEEMETTRPKMHKKYSFDTKDNEKLKIKEARISSQINKSIDKTSAKQLQISTLFNADTDTSSTTSKVDAETSSNSGDSWTPSKRPVRNIKKRTFSEDFVEYYENPVVQSDCHRVKPVAKKYLKSYKYTSEVFKSDFIFNVTDADLFKIRLQQTNTDVQSTEAELLKLALVQEKMSDQFKQSHGRSKRKQTLSSRSDENFNFASKISIENRKFNDDAAIQRRRKVTAQPIRRSTDLQPVFDGEIIVDEQNMELLKKMGPKTVADGYARLLPWQALMNSFRSNSINIWSMVDQPSRLLINKVDKKCPKNYINIKDTTQMTEVIVWILNNKLPSHYHQDSLSFILKETKDNFEICGICTKNVTSSTSMMFKEYKNEKGELFYHKDLNGVERTLMMYKENNFQYQQLKSITSGDDLVQHFTVRLPKIYNFCKWRMIFLNSDFTFLHFKSTEYSIRYTDLNAISEYAKKNDGTVALINKELQKAYDHILFGIYFDGQLSDRVFIGPYFRHKDMDDDIETLRYINQNLISTESFNKMRGKGDYKCGHWLIQANIKQKTYFKEESSSSTIDLTSETEEKQRKYSSLIIHNNEVIKIIDAPPRKPEDFNRYISTNIPHFGYLGALIHLNGEIDVSWPFENKLLRFKSEMCATSFLQERFSSLLQCVPETFKINIIVSVKIDLSEKPINSSVLNGHYICGEFGYYNILSLTDNECREKIGFTKEDILKLFAKRAQAFVRKKIEDLAAILTLPSNKPDINDLSLILKKANEEIITQKKLESSYMETKKQLYSRKRKNALKLHRILLTLPQEKRNIENLKFREIVRKREPIEINDSDEELNKMDKQNKIFKTPPPVTYSLKAGCKTNLKSVLKPLVSVPVDQSTSVLLRGRPPSSTEVDPLATSEPKSDTKLIKGVKLVKTSKGYLIVSADNKNDGQQKPASAANPKKIVIINKKETIGATGSSSISTSTPCDVSASNPPSSDNSASRLSNIVTSKPSPAIISETNSSSSNSSSLASSNSISVSRFKNSKAKKEDTYNIDETIIIDLDEEIGATSDKVTELHIMGDKIVKKVKDNVENKGSNLEVSKYVVKKFSTSIKQNCDKREDTKEPATVIDLDKEFDEAIEPTTGYVDESRATITKITQKIVGEVINLDESEDEDEFNNKSPLRPEFVSVNDGFNDKIDYSNDMDISIHGAEETELLESAEKTSEVCSPLENTDTDILYIS